VRAAQGSLQAPPFQRAAWPRCAPVGRACTRFVPLARAAACPHACSSPTGGRGRDSRCIPGRLTSRRTEALDQIAADDRVVERWTATGTHQGEFLGIEGSGAKLDIDGMDISRLEQGKIVEHWTQLDASR
jgi:SnoaL-like polyketide cyclase